MEGGALAGIVRHRNHQMQELLTAVFPQFFVA